jgi:hypothetical protein
MYSRKLEKPESEYPSAKIFEMASTIKVMDKEDFNDTQQTKSNQKVKISINSSSIMRVKDSDRLRGLLQKIERSRAIKMQAFPDMGVKKEEIHSLALGENIPSKILNERKLNQRFIHRGASTSRRVSPPAKTP